MSGLPASGLLDAGIQPAGPQVDVVVEREPDAQQQAAFEHTAGHRRVADGAEQDRVVAAQFVDARRRAAPRRSRGSAARRGRSSVFSTPGSTASSTLTASPTTSGPIPSPAMIANSSRQINHFQQFGADSLGDRGAHVGGHVAVDAQQDRRARTLRVLAELCGVDVDVGAAEQRADLAERARLVDVVDDQVDALGAQIEVAAVDLDDLLDLLRARQRARDVGDRAVGRTPPARRRRCGGWGSRWRC